jgi:hypothetical protein
MRLPFLLANRDYEMMHLRQMQDVIHRSRDLLAQYPALDSFAGRKTQEPFPAKDP